MEFNIDYFKKNKNFILILFIVIILQLKKWILNTFGKI